MQEKIDGVISLALPGPGILGGYWGLYFTNNRILVVELDSILKVVENFAATKAGAVLATGFILGIATRNSLLKLAFVASTTPIVAAELKNQVEKQVEISKAFANESPENLLSIGTKNFQIEYNKITGVTLKRSKWLANKMSILTESKTYNYDLMTKFEGVDDASFNDFVKLLKSLFADKFKQV